MSTSTLLAPLDVAPPRTDFTTRGLQARVETELPALAPYGAIERRAEFLALAEVESTHGRAELPLSLRVLNDPVRPGRLELLASQYQLTLRIIVPADGPGQLDWTLEPGGGDASARARVIDFLAALSGDGVLTVNDPELGSLVQVRLNASPLDPTLAEERRFLTDVMVVEGWSGYRLHLPTEVGEKGRHGDRRIRRPRARADGQDRDQGRGHGQPQRASNRRS